MKLADSSLTQFSELLSSDAPAPGGGSAAALEGALGAALTHMVAGLTVGKKEYAEYESLMQELMVSTDDIQGKLISIIDSDTEAFNSVSAVFSMPKNTDAERNARRSAMQTALKACTLTPHSIMLYSLEALELTQKALGKSNISAASDLGVAALSLKAAVQGAWLNILINIGSITDEAFAERYRAEGEAILEKALPLADDIYKTILAGL